MPGTVNADTYYGMGGNDTMTGAQGNEVRLRTELSQPDVAAIVRTL